jgi:Ca-activated chloride channel family protein
LGGAILIKNKLMAIMLMLFLLLPVSYLGCGGGGGSDSTPPPPSPSIEVLPASYDFGSITPGNTPAALQVVISNTGTAALNVTNIASADSNFVVDLNGGSNPCVTAAATIAASGNCTLAVSFQPSSNGHFDGNLTISSNDSSHPTLNVPLSGDREAISELNLKINQVDTCTTAPIFTAYVSVLDQGGYPVTSLTAPDFTITENSADRGNPTASFVSDAVTLSVSLVMDNSSSITEIPDALADMQQSVSNFVTNLGANDEAEIIKFAEQILVAQDFTSNQTLLTDAINSSANIGENTALYDAIVKAVDDEALRTKNRKAVIVITDGMDDDGTHTHQLSTHTLNDVITDANNNSIPIFTIGLGSQINLAVLQQIADDTGGQYFGAATSDNLRTIYQQLADVLFNHQYILTYTTGLGADVTAPLKIEATLPSDPTVKGNDTKSISTTCP